jgi:diaminohydroxyphosphoribosylaminopyrimidine deaminase/5-amino-6-(5-phosphoribosylamino)uracil reductase
MTPDQDKHYIQRCFELALRGKGLVSPNPLVGCVIAKDDHIISEGWHKQLGADHAEAMALKKAKGDLSGATLYCNLEPCCHINKKTPPCLPLVINSGIKRVVLSNADPNPAVSGKSIKQMREHGIEVVENFLEDEGTELNRFFFKHISTGMPWITVKIAQTMDSKISLKQNKQTWISSKESKKHVHELRSLYDAVLIGAKTVNIDDPSLDVRMIEGRNPIKIIIDGNLNFNADAKLFSDTSTRTLIYHKKTENVDNNKLIKISHIEFIGLDSNESNRINLEDVFTDLGKRGINSVLVEGGASIFTQCISQKLYDEVIIFQAPKFWGNGVPAIENGINEEMHIQNVMKMGKDCYINLRKN